LAILIVGRVTRVETISQGRKIRELGRLERTYGPGQWRKRKGVARVRLPDGSMSLAELHWYEAHGIGRREFKLKRLIEEPR
jgi:hypothetical protein